MKTEEQLKIYHSIKEYCDKYNIPINSLLDILEDQKVLPMIRGKATEYIAVVVITKTLNSREWHVQKLNLNPQANQDDEDISITFSRTGKRLKVEAKSAVRGSFKQGTSRTKIPKPHFKVKCHKSRSNISKSNTTNDRYMANEFDVIICNISNALFKGKSMRPELELIEAGEAVSWLKNFYKVETDKELIRSAYDDWMFCFPKTIALEDGSIPRTPTVKIEDDENWFRVSELETKLLERIEQGII